MVSGILETDKDHPLSLQRLGTPVKPGAPSTGLLIHAFNCRGPVCVLPGCAEGRTVVAKLATHNATCPTRRDVDPKTPHPDRNKCPSCRLYEALQSTPQKLGLVRRATAAVQQRASNEDYDRTWQTALRSQNPDTMRRVLQQHINVCLSPTTCLVCKKVREHHRAVTAQCLAGDEGAVEFPTSLFAGLTFLGKRERTADPAPASGTYDEADVEFVREETLEQRNACGFACAVDVDDTVEVEAGAEAARPAKRARRSVRIEAAAKKAEKK
tara:strand:- start:264 stop:1070 length:807 start_codon:yes stop_codon:yes gene_type:complete